MNVNLAEQLPGTDAANAELDKMIAADAAAAGKAADGQGGKSAIEDAAAETAADQAQSAGQTAEGNAQASNAVDEAAKKAAEEAAKSKDQAKPGEAKPGDDGKSRYAKAQQRLAGGWDELNAGKTTLKSEREAFAKEREQFERERQSYQTEREEAEREFRPEAYDEAAKRFEAEGKFDLAQLARDRAAELRKNPPAKAGEKDAAQRKEWALKAGTDFPDLAKENSPLQVRVAQLLKEEPEFKRHPQGIYFAARLADLEAQVQKHKSAADGVAAKDKELGELREKVKQLEGLTAPGGEGGAQRLPGAKSFEQMSESEQFAELQRTAREVGPLG
jgi:hypothetical protein